MTTGLLFGLAPAIQSTRVDVMPALKETRAGQPGSRHSFRRPGLSQALVVSQIAISLLIVAYELGEFRFTSEIALWLVMFFALVSGVDYFIKFARAVLRDEKPA